jgi:apolipoprotein D and lipocalin family protein
MEQVQVNGVERVQGWRDAERPLVQAQEGEKIEQRGQHGGGHARAPCPGRVGAGGYTGTPQSWTSFSMQLRYAQGRMLFALCLLALQLAGCTGVPEGVRPVTGFQLDRYLGTWHEIARLDHAFERGLTDVSARYSRRADGGVDVLNRGYDAAKNQWKEVRGRAYFLDGPDVGSLEVSFFGPFYGGYHVFALAPDYRWALVAGYSHDYLWILARERQLPPAVLADLLAKARTAGFATDALIFPGGAAP